MPHSSSGCHQPGGAGFTQSFCPIQQLLLCIGVALLVLILALRCVSASHRGAGAVGCIWSWQGRAAQQLVPISFRGQGPCFGDESFGLSKAVEPRDVGLGWE